MKFALAIFFSGALSVVFASFRNVLLEQLVSLRDMASEFVEASSDVAPSREMYPYFNFMPQFVKPVFEGLAPVSWESACFKSNKITMAKSADKTQYELKITNTLPQTLKSACSESYLLLSASSLKIFHIHSAGVQPTQSSQINVTIPENVNTAELWDLETNGLRLLRFVDSFSTSAANLIQTLDLFIPEFSGHVNNQVAKSNIDFLDKFAQVKVNPVDSSTFKVPDESEIHSGDFFGIMRLDGLNPMLAWAMGSTTGHTTTALWDKGQLFIVESTTDSTYWPTNGIQRTPYRQWLQQAKDADFQVVWAPLTAAARSNYNETAAIEFFESVEGLDYGFYNMIFAWIDTAAKNFPCLPPDYASNCMQWELFEPLLAHIDRRIPEIGDKIINGALNVRLGTSGLRTVEAYMEGSKRGIRSIDLMTSVELDSYVYDTTRNGVPARGKSMVCCVLVCNMWKAAGVFGELTQDINCAEQTNWDDYSLTIMDQGQRQIIGDYTLELAGYSSRAPYAHMNEKCGSLPPDYIREAGC